MVGRSGSVVMVALTVIAMLGVAALGALDVNEGTYTITGTVTDGHHPLSYAKVTVGEETVDVDAYGRFSVEVRGAGAYDVTATAYGHWEHVKRVNVIHGGNASVDLGLPRDVTRQVTFLSCFAHIDHDHGRASSVIDVNGDNVLSVGDIDPLCDGDEGFLVSRCSISTDALNEAYPSLSYFRTITFSGTMREGEVGNIFAVSDLGTYGYIDRADHLPIPDRWMDELLEAPDVDVVLSRIIDLDAPHHAWRETLDAGGSLTVTTMNSGAHCPPDCYLPTLEVDGEEYVLNVTYRSEEGGTCSLTVTNLDEVPHDYLFIVEDDLLIHCWEL